MCPAPAPAVDRPAGDEDLLAAPPPPLLCGRLPDAFDGWTRDPCRGVELLHVARIIPDPDQPRKRLDPTELIRLADSVRRRGLLQPVRVQWLPERGAWMLVAGERRWQAAIAAGLVSVPAIRADGELTEAQALAEQLAEQLLRAGLDPIEEGRAYRRLLAMTGWTQQRVAAECHLDASRVCRLVRLLDLDPSVQVDVAEGRIAPAAAAELLRLPAGATQRQAAARTIGERLTAAGVAEVVQEQLSEHNRFMGHVGRPRSPALQKRVVIRIETGRVTVQATGDVVTNLELAIAVQRQQPRAAA